MLRQTRPRAGVWQALLAARRAHHLCETDVRRLKAALGLVRAGSSLRNPTAPHDMLHMLGTNPLTARTRRCGPRQTAPLRPAGFRRCTMQCCSLACGKPPRLVVRSGAVAAAAVAQRKEAERTHARHLEMFARGTIADLQARSPPAPLCVGCHACRTAGPGANPPRIQRRLTRAGGPFVRCGRIGLLHGPRLHQAKADAKELQLQRDFTERLGTAEAEAARAHADLSRLRASEAKATLAASAAESARERLEVRCAGPAGRLGGAAVGASRRA
jgi:hypothetical protein